MLRRLVVQYREAVFVVCLIHCHTQHNYLHDIETEMTRLAPITLRPQSSYSVHLCASQAHK